MPAPEPSNQESPSPSGAQTIAIIGGGWAGLAAAVSLCRDHQVHLFESSPQLGGRARSIEWNDIQLDNGQHLAIGAYQQMLELLQTMQAEERFLFKRIPHEMLMMDVVSASVALKLSCPTFPAPFHLLFGVLNIPQLSLLEKLQLLLRFNRLLNRKIKQDLSVSEWLDSARLPQAFSENLLKPICLAALTTHPHEASARAFQSVLQQTFNAPADHTDLLIPSRDLSQVFPEIAEKYIRQHNGKVYKRHRLKRLTSQQGELHSLFINDKEYQFEHVILATPPRVTAALLSDMEETRDISEKINQLEYEPIATLYLQFAEPVRLGAPMIGLVNGIGEWVFERATSGQPDILAVVISATGEYLHMDKASLSQQILNELRQLDSALPELIDSKLIIDKAATIRCVPGVDNVRPEPQTPLSKLKLCGDYVYIEEKPAPGLPSTLEGALRSGVKCATLINNT